MFDIGFWELTMISVVALLVIGPERLPGVIKTIGQWVGQIRRMFASLKTEIEREANVTELKNTISKESERINKLMDEALDVIEGQEPASGKSSTSMEEKTPSTSGAKPSTGYDPE